MLSAFGFELFYNSVLVIQKIPLHVFAVSGVVFRHKSHQGSACIFFQDVHVPLVVYDIGNKSATLECVGSFRMLLGDTLSGGSSCGCFKIPSAII